MPLTRAEISRRHRHRLAAERQCVRVDIGYADIDTLIDHGFLPADRSRNHDAVAAAIQGLLGFLRGKNTVTGNAARVGRGGIQHDHDD